MNSAVPPHSRPLHGLEVVFQRIELDHVHNSNDINTAKCCTFKEQLLSANL